MQSQLKPTHLKGVCQQMLAECKGMREGRACQYRIVCSLAVYFCPNWDMLVLNRFTPYHFWKLFGGLLCPQPRKMIIVVSSKKVPTKVPSDCCDYIRHHRALQA